MLTTDQVKEFKVCEIYISTDINLHTINFAVFSSGRVEQTVEQLYVHSCITALYLQYMQATLMALHSCSGSACHQLRKK